VRFEDEKVLNENIRYKSLHFVYNLKMNVPVRDYMILSFGLRYSFNYFGYHLPADDQQNLLSSQTIESALFSRNLLNILNLEAGVAFPF